MLRKVYPWLVPLIVTVVLVLSFVVAEQVRSNTPEGKFNSVQPGMDREAVLSIMGEPAFIGTFSPPDIWHFDKFLVEVSYEENKAVSKRMDLTSLPPPP